MSLNRRTLLGAAALSSALPSLGIPALAQGNVGGNWPTRLVVSYPPGGTVDLTRRILAERLQPLLGQSVVVDMRANLGCPRATVEEAFRRIKQAVAAR
ncbi:hypothetical protein NF552_25830 (plasmid) [Roseomonas mucosa]|nr:hypothetical protein NF552_25830 [Roseomonas mucosa]